VQWRNLKTAKDTFVKQINSRVSGQRGECVMMGIFLNFLYFSSVSLQYILKKILLIQTAFTGDVVLATPVLEKLHKFFSRGGNRF